jgi:hypothetical protein
MSTSLKIIHKKQQYTLVHAEPGILIYISFFKKSSPPIRIIGKETVLALDYVVLLYHKSTVVFEMHQSNLHTKVRVNSIRCA